MKYWKSTLTIAALTFAGLPAFGGQSEDELDGRVREVELRLAQQEVDEQVPQVQPPADVAELDPEEYEMRMHEAERRMAEAARQVAELSMRKLPRVERIERIIQASRGPVLGITIGATDSAGPVEGVEILGISPGGAAEEAGLRAGDVITSINDEELTADNNDKATEKLLEFMQGVEDGVELKVAFLRNGKSDTASLTPRAMDHNVFAYQFNDENFSSPEIEMHVAPMVKNFENSYVWTMHDDGFGDMELVKLTDRLGSYFGTAEGLLVVRSPGKEELKLQDGDVILNIDGRTPNSVGHAMRILGSYQAGEELKIEIMRDKKKRTIAVQIPDNRRSWAQPGTAPRVEFKPARATIRSRAVIARDERM